VSSAMRMKPVLACTLLGLLVLALNVSGGPSHQGSHARPKSGAKQKAPKAAGKQKSHKAAGKEKAAKAGAKDHQAGKTAAKGSAGQKTGKKGAAAGKKGGKKAGAVAKTADPKAEAAAKHAQAHHEAVLKERQERQRLEKENLQKLQADRRQHAEGVYRREHELRAELHRKNDLLREGTLRGSGAVGVLTTAAVRSAAGSWGTWDRAAYDRLAAYARTSPNAQLGTALNSANALQRLTAAERLALIRARDGLIHDTALAAATRAANRQSLNQALWRDNFLAREAAYRQALANLLPRATFQPAAVTAPVVVAGINPAVNWFLLPASPSAGNARTSSGAVQILPGPGETGKPSQKSSAEDAEAVSLIDDGGAVLQTTRYLRLGNATARPLRVFLTYHTETAAGQPQWVPPDGKGQQPLTITLKPGEVVSLRDGGWRVHADQVRLWAEGDGRTWDQFRTEPLWLVPEVDAEGRHAYQAPVRDVFTYSFK
jgi:hypothetical protein